MALRRGCSRARELRLRKNKGTTRRLNAIHSLCFCVTWLLEFIRVCNYKYKALGTDQADLAKTQGAQEKMTTTREQ